MPDESNPVDNQKPAEFPKQEINLTNPTKGINKLFLALGVLVIVALLGAGGYLVLNKTSNKNPKTDTTKQASSSSKQTSKDKDAQSETITKVGFVDKNNIWVLDVVSKKKTQITKDGSNDLLYRNPTFLTQTTFVFVKEKGSGSELWQGVFKGNKFSLSQDKKFKKPIYLTDITKDYKKLLFNYFSDKVTVHLFDLTTDQDKVLYEKASVGRGASQDDAFSAKFSPDTNKVLIVDTFYSTDEKILVFDTNGAKVASIKGDVTLPVWVSNTSFVYKEISEGMHIYDLASKTDEKISSEKDWSSPSVSPDGKNLAHSKGYAVNESEASDSSVGLFNLNSKIDKSLGKHLATPAWVNDNILVTLKLRECNSGECVTDGSFTGEKTIVIINLSTGQKSEVSTLSAPSF
ncbi:MAG: DPP IV N-terminal domain-containing protein [bacterium]|nr:DPP IV N-terminal domain-containing protein [bacterium]